MNETDNMTNGLLRMILISMRAFVENAKSIDKVLEYIDTLIDSLDENKQ